eukprot:GEMP01073697.1.p1 GENE.GEMP01073697.1~~GEMP01073697.1.p1  ORF type:complete len:149 (+),score=18.95 GEMP01073697.1:293-739(+)
MKLVNMFFDTLFGSRDSMIRAVHSNHRGREREMDITDVSDTGTVTDETYDFNDPRHNVTAEVFAFPAGHPKPLGMHKPKVYDVEACKRAMYNPTPVRVKIEASQPYRMQDLPTVYLKVIPSPKHCNQLKLRIESPDVHTVVLPDAYFL